MVGTWALWTVLVCARAPAGASPAADADATRPALLDVLFLSDTTFVAGSHPSLQLLIRAATDLDQAGPLAGAAVEVFFEADARGAPPARGRRTAPAPVRLGGARSDAQGLATVALDIPAQVGETGQLVVRTHSPWGNDERRRAVRFNARPRLVVVTDRARYRPATPLHWRVYAFNGADRRPIAGAELDVRLVDPRGTVVRQENVQTSAHGLAGAAWPLADNLRLGAYRLRVRLAGAEAERSVEVRTYRLPDFAVHIALDQESVTPGGVVGGVVQVATFQGEPLRAKAEVCVDGPRAPRVFCARDRTGPDGRFRFSLDVPRGMDGPRLALSARARDGAGRTEDATTEVVLADGAVRLTLLGGEEGLVAGQDNGLTVITSDRAGRPVPAELHVEFPGQSAPLTVRSTGVYPLTLRPPGVTSATDTALRRVVDELHVLEGALSEAEERTLRSALDAQADALARQLDGEGRELGQARAERHILVLKRVPPTGFAVVQAERRFFGPPDDFALPASAGIMQRLGLNLRGVADPRDPAAATGPLRVALTLVERASARTTETPLSQWTLRVVAGAAGGATDTAERTFGRRASAPLPLDVLLDRVIVPAEGRLRVRVGARPTRATDGAAGDAGRPVQLLLVHAGQPVGGAELARADGAAAVDLSVPPGVAGLVEIHAWRWPNAAAADAERPERGAALALVRPGGLELTLSADPTRVAPGGQARLSVEARDGAGRPAFAALGVLVRDVRSAAEGGALTPLTTALLDPQLAAAEIAERTLGDLLATPDGDGAGEALARSLLARETPLWQPRWVARTDVERFRAERHRAARIATELHRRLGASPVPLGHREPGAGWRFNDFADLLAGSEAVPPAELRDPWGRPIDEDYVRRLDPAFHYDTLARRVAEARMAELASRATRSLLPRARKVVRQGRLTLPPDWLEGLQARGRARPLWLADPWGNPFVLTSPDAGASHDIVSAGPDGAFDTADDLRRKDVLWEVLAAAAGRVHGRLGRLAGYGSGYGVAGALGARRTVAPRIVMGAASVQAGEREPPRVRRRFLETAFFAPEWLTDANGKAELTFDLPDDLTRWQVAVDAHDGLGRAGHGETALDTFAALSIDVQPPTQLSVGDALEAQAVVTNLGAEPATVEVTVRGGETLAAHRLGAALTTVPPGESRAVPYALRALGPGRGTVFAEARTVAPPTAGAPLVPRAESPGDAIERGIDVLPDGGEAELAQGGLLRDTALATFVLPPERLPGAVRFLLRAYGDAGAPIVEGLEGLLTEPYGCFEQTSATTYPNLLVLSYLAGLPRPPAKAAARARRLVREGYERLLRFEVHRGGFSWFGDAPANRVLTAFGLEELTDMARVVRVDPELLRRTAAWLENQQAPDGSWAPDAHFLHTQVWGGVQRERVLVTAWVAHALAAAGRDGAALRQALGYLAKHRARLSEDPYTAALYADTLLRQTAARQTPHPLVRELLGRASRSAEGMVFRPQGVTPVGGRGPTAEVETTALAAQVLVRGGAGAVVGDALRFLLARRAPDGAWGSTQATVQALKALLAAEPATPRAAPGAPAGFALALNGKALGAHTVDPSAGFAVAAVDLSAALVPGPNELRLTTAAGGRPLLYHLSGTYWLPWAEQPADGDLAVAYRPPSRWTVGQPVAVTLGLLNRGAEGVAMPVVVLPLPPAVRVEPLPLDRLVAEQALARYDDRGSELHLYLKELPARSAWQATLTLTAELPGEVRQRPALLYEYYAPEHRAFSRPERLTFTRPEADLADPADAG